MMDTTLARIYFKFRTHCAVTLTVQPYIKWVSSTRSQGQHVWKTLQSDIQTLIWYEMYVFMRIRMCFIKLTSTHFILQMLKRTLRRSSLFIFLFISTSNSFICVFSLRVFWVNPVNALHTHTHRHISDRWEIEAGDVRPSGEFALTVNDAPERKSSYGYRILSKWERSRDPTPFPDGKPIRLLIFDHFFSLHTTWKPPSADTS